MSEQPLISMTKGEGETAFTVDESPKDLGLWECLSTTFSAVFPPGEEPDPAIVSQCRNYDPHFVPLFCRKVYRTPANTEHEFHYVVIGRYVPSDEIKTDKTDKPPVKLSAWPKDFPFSPYDIYELYPWTVPVPKGSPLDGFGLPDFPKPFDGRVVEYVKCQEYARANNTEYDWFNGLRQMRYEDEKQVEKYAEDLAYAMKQDWSLVDPDEDFKSTLKEVNPKPFVEVKGVQE